MKNITHHTGKLEIISRLPSSYYGNPRFLVSVGGTECVTAVNSGHGYSIENHKGRIVEATIGMHYGRSTLNTIKRL